MLCKNILILVEQKLSIHQIDEKPLRTKMILEVSPSEQTLSSLNSLASLRV